MNRFRTLNVKGANLDKNQLEKYLENLAAEHNVKKKSDVKTFPIHSLKDNFNMITETYKLLTKQLKQGILLHSAGEWILDNYYIIEETVKTVEKDLSLKKYKNFVQITNENFKGFARVYVLAAEIVRIHRLQD